MTRGFLITITLCIAIILITGMLVCDVSAEPQSLFEQDTQVDKPEWKVRWFNSSNLTIEVALKYGGIYKYNPKCVFESKTQYKFVSPDMIFEKLNVNYIQKITIIGNKNN